MVTNSVKTFKMVYIKRKKKKLKKNPLGFPVRALPWVPSPWNHQAATQRSAIFLFVFPLRTVGQVIIILSPSMPFPICKPQILLILSRKPSSVIHQLPLCGVTGSENL